jgi:hypothetical protein
MATSWVGNLSKKTPTKPLLKGFWKERTMTLTRLVLVPCAENISCFNFFFVSIDFFLMQFLLQKNMGVVGLL